MDIQDILARLRENQAALKAQGVRHAALFGSRARGDNHPDSDIDILVEIAPESYVWETVHVHLAPLLTVVLAEIRALEP
jgi:predicted nucleotidyltransferase